MTASHDVAVVGGGCVGLSIAFHVAERGLDVCVLETEDRLASHQNGHNSGVLFPGFVYEPGSQRANLYREGTARAKAFCRDRGVPTNECGQLMLARTPAEADRLENLDGRAAENDVETTRSSSTATRGCVPNSWASPSGTTPRTADPHKRLFGPVALAVTMFDRHARGDRR